MVNQNTAKNSNICHIEAANSDGQRYRTNMTDKERADYDNLILLCVDHHTETDDVDRYTVVKLKQMKDEHEAKIASRTLGRSPSMLRIAIDKISKIGLNGLKNINAAKSFNITTKLDYNGVTHKRRLINELKVYYHKLNVLYDELDSVGSLKKEHLLDNIRHIYLDVSGRYTGQNDNYMPIIKQNSDAIFEEVFNELLQLVDFGDISVEELSPALRVVMVDAFMRCKILEEPI
ncbi:MAG: ABC-three component system protein [Glaciecola sp.]|jgi:hypothetical protein